jgi:hypothetical protein
MQPASAPVRSFALNLAGAWSLLMIIDPSALQDKLHSLFNQRSFAGLLILKLDMVDECDSPLGIG